MNIDHKMIAPTALANALTKFGVTIPRQLRIDAMKTILQPLHARELLDFNHKLNDDKVDLDLKEYSRLHRLKEYNALSEFQLENEFSYYNDPGLNDNYLTLFWNNVTTLLEQRDDFEQIQQEITNLPSKPQMGNRTIVSYNKVFHSLCTDPEEYFDGIPFDKAVTHFVATSNRKELYALGTKYGLAIPKYLNKADLQIRLKHVLREAGKLDDAMEDIINKSSVKELKQLLLSNNSDSKANITKEKMVEMIIADVNNRRLEALQQATDEDVVMEPEPEPVVESVPDVVPAPVVVRELETSENDYSEYLMQIIENQKRMITLLEGSENTEITVKDHSRANRIFNYIVITLIILVSIIWIVYGITTLF